MPDLIERYKQCKAKYDSLDRELTSEESSFKTLKEQYDNQVAEVCREYSVSSLAEAQALLENESKELEEIVKKAEAQFASIASDITI